jgi:hypothetical protein
MSTTKQNEKPPAANKPLPVERLECLTITYGAHHARTDGVCLLEAVAWFAGEKHSDTPRCVPTSLAEFGRAFNDGLGQGVEADAARTRMLKRFIPDLVGAPNTPALEQERAFLAMDWLVRVHTPAWLELRDATKPIAAELKALPAIADVAGLVAAQPILDRARTAASSDAAAAWDAARDAARDAAWDAAWAAARAAARDAAWDAAWDAARDAAWDAARDAAYPVAYAAAMAIFKPVVAALQESALDLFARMIGCGRS